MTGLRTRRSVAYCAYYTRTMQQMVRDAFLAGAGTGLSVQLVGLPGGLNPKIVGFVGASVRVRL